jgi:hypothetical protein
MIIFQQPDFGTAWPNHSVNIKNFHPTAIKFKRVSGVCGLRFYYRPIAAGHGG